MTILNSELKKQLDDTIQLMFETTNMPKRLKRKLFLDAKIKRLQHEAEKEYIKNQVSKWIELNEDFISKVELKNLWKKVSTKSCLDFVNMVIKSLAVVDGINKSEEVFNYVLDMNEVKIDKSMIANLSDKIFSIDTLNLLLDQTNLKEEEKSLIKQNYINTKFPSKQNTLVDHIANEVNSVNEL